MSLNYLCYSIFQPAVLEMATSSGSIQQRLRLAHQGYLYKIMDSDLDDIPEDSKEKFIELRNIIPNKINKIGDDLQNELAKFGVQDIHKIDPHKEWVYKKLHWKTAHRAARLIADLYESLLFELEEKNRFAHHAN